MKRKSLVCLLVTLLLLCSCVFTGCKERIAHAETNFLATTQVEQESQKVETEDGEKIIQAKLISKDVVGGYMFLQYKIGKISNCFIQTLTQPVRGAKTIRYETGQMNAKTITNGIANYISTTKEISTTETNANTIEWDFSANNTTEVSATVGVNVGVSAFGVSAGSSAEAGVKDSYTVAAGIGGSNSNETSQTIGEAVTQETHTNIDVSDMEERFTNISYEFDMNDYEKGYFYALCLVMDLEVYQIISYNVQTEEFYTSYFMTKMIGVPAMDMLSSEDKVFGVSADYQLSPITKINVEEIEIFTPEEKPTTSWEKFSQVMNNYSCIDNTNYSENNKNTDTEWDKRHSGWELGELSFYGLEKNQDGFKIKNRSDFAIKYNLLQNIAELPLGTGIATSQVLVSDTASVVYNTNINSAIGKGAYWIRVTYSDDSQKEVNATNFLDGKNKGAFIDLLTVNDIEVNKKIYKIEIVVVYELNAGAPGVLGFWWVDTINWRCEYTCIFN